MSSATLAISLGACGGSGHRSTKTGTTTTHVTGATTLGSAPPRRILAEEVRPVGAAKNFAPILKVKPGEGVILRTTVPPHALPVKLTFHTGPAAVLTVTARSRGRSVTARLIGTGHSHISLVDISYSCSLPPVPSVCPPKNVHSRSGTTSATFSTQSPLLILARVGPLTKTARKLPRAASTVMPPYMVAEEVVSVTPPVTRGGRASATPIATSARTRPGDVLMLSTHLRARTAGVPQTVTVTVNQGPGKVIAIRAAVPGGKPATATVMSATGAKIALVTPHYSCLLPPAHTFCPAIKVMAGSRRYIVKFAASPATPPIVIVAKVQPA